MTSETASEVHLDIGLAIGHAALEVFSTMLGMEITPGEASVSKSEQEFQGNVVALLGLTGDWSGSGQISVDPSFACRIASQMLMAEYETVSEDVLDAVAEIANMVIGNIKNLLEDRLGPMGLSTPTIVFGGHFETRVAGSPDRVSLPFTCSDGLMTVQVVLAQKRGDGALRERQCVPQMALAN